MSFVADMDVVRGRTLLAARSLAGINQRSMAKLLNWTPQKLSAFENGAHVGSKTWSEIRKILAGEGIKVAVVFSKRRVNISGSFILPDVEDDDQEVIT